MGLAEVHREAADREADLAAVDHALADVTGADVPENLGLSA
jgi:hypothetical protein